MSRLALLTLLSALSVLATEPLPDRQAAARQLIDKALLALGGDDKVLALPARQCTATGKLYQFGVALPYTAEHVFHAADRWRTRLTLDTGLGKITKTIGYDRGQAWEKTGDTLTEKTPAQAAEIGQFVYYIWVHQLAALRSPMFTLEALGASKIDETPVQGVKVSSKGHRDIRLFFDAQTGLLIASESLALDEASGKEVPFATRLGGYVKIDGVGYYTTIQVRRDGKPYYDEKLGDQKRAAQLPDAAFAKP